MKRVLILLILALAPLARGDVPYLVVPADFQDADTGFRFSIPIQDTREIRFECFQGGTNWAPPASWIPYLKYGDDVDDETPFSMSGTLSSNVATFKPTTTFWLNTGDDYFAGLIFLNSVTTQQVAAAQGFVDITKSPGLVATQTATSVYDTWNPWNNISSRANYFTVIDTNNGAALSIMATGGLPQVVWRQSNGLTVTMGLVGGSLGTGAGSSNQIVAPNAAFITDERDLISLHLNGDNYMTANLNMGGFSITNVSTNSIIFTDGRKLPQIVDEARAALNTASNTLTTQDTANRSALTAASNAFVTADAVVRTALTTASNAMLAGSGGNTMNQDINGDGEEYGFINMRVVQGGTGAFRKVTGDGTALTGTVDVVGRSMTATASNALVAADGVVRTALNTASNALTTATALTRSSSDVVSNQFSHYTANSNGTHFGALTLTDVGEGSSEAPRIQLIPTGTPAQVWAGVLNPAGTNNDWSYIYMKDGFGNEAYFTFKNQHWDYGGKSMTNMGIYYGGDFRGNSSATRVDMTNGILIYNGTNSFNWESRKAYDSANREVFSYATNLVVWTNAEFRQLVSFGGMWRTNWPGPTEVWAAGGVRTSDNLRVMVNTSFVQMGESYLWAWDQNLTSSVNASGLSITNLDTLGAKTIWDTNKIVAFNINATRTAHSTNGTQMFAWESTNVVVNAPAFGLGGQLLTNLFGASTASNGNLLKSEDIRTLLATDRTAMNTSSNATTNLVTQSAWQTGSNSLHSETLIISNLFQGKFPAVYLTAASGTLSTTNYIVFASGAVTLTLHSVSGMSGKTLDIKNVGITNVVINPGGVLIDTNTTFTLGPRDALSMVTEGTNWWIR